MLYNFDFWLFLNLGRAVFRLVYADYHHDLKHTDFKHHDFECDIDTAKQIVFKICNILDMRLSPVYKDYGLYLEKKTNRRQTVYKRD